MARVCVVSKDGGKTWEVFNPKVRKSDKQAIVQDENGRYIVKVTR